MSWKFEFGYQSIRKSGSGYRGVGRKMLQVIMDWGRLNGITNFHVSAQIGAVGFYQKMGFEPYGEEFEEAGIKHVNMKIKAS